MKCQSENLQFNSSNLGQTPRRSSKCCHLLHLGPDPDGPHVFQMETLVKSQKHGWGLRTDAGSQNGPRRLEYHPCQLLEDVPKDCLVASSFSSSSKASAGPRNQNIQNQPRRLVGRAWSIKITNFLWPNCCAPHQVQATKQHSLRALAKALRC